MPPLLQATRAVPIVFPVVNDPVTKATSTAWRGRVVTQPVL